MAKAKQKSTTSAEAPVSWPFGRKNYILFGAALAVITLGYIFLGWGDDPNNPISLTLAPIVLVIGYFMVPFAIMAKNQTGDTPTDDETAQQE